MPKVTAWALEEMYELSLWLNTTLQQVSHFLGQAERSRYLPVVRGTIQRTPSNIITALLWGYYCTGAERTVASIH